MRKHNTSPSSGIQRCNHVLDKSIISITFRGNTKPEAPIRIILGFFITPVLKREWGIGNKDIESHELPIFGKNLW